jgi:hypothetical protein
MMLNKLFRTWIIPAKVGIQKAANWTPAFAGVTSYSVYFVELISLSSSQTWQPEGCNPAICPTPAGASYLRMTMGKYTQYLRSTVTCRSESWLSLPELSYAETAT